MTVRLRQVVLAAPDLQPLADQIQGHFGLPEPFHDPGVAEFGLENAVFAVGDTFLEIVSPTRADTAAGRYLARRGNPEAAGYMAIFQVDDVAAARARVAGLGVRVVWQADLADVAGTHLHPADVPGAIVSIDWADPPESWHWAGPRWRGQADPEREPGAIDGFTLATADPAGAEKRWAEVLDTPLSDLGVDVVDPSQGADGIVEIRLGRSHRPAPDLPVGTVLLRN
jgi:Glyoxalase-like domain